MQLSHIPPFNYDASVLFGNVSGFLCRCKEPKQRRETNYDALLNPLNPSYLRENNFSDNIFFISKLNYINKTDIKSTQTFRKNNLETY
jgi:hypothetical protein